MKDFSRILTEWYRDNGRHDLPWRQVRDPYLIWISEVILQQTRIAQGREYYRRFTERFPDVFTLARAHEDEVLKLWQGLGYYSRARNLHNAAKSVAQIGKFPESHAEIRRLKGIGDYTAAAICAFAYHQPYAVVDGNVYRILSRIFGIATPMDTTAGKREFSALAARLLDEEQPQIHNSAIMDFGAMQCTPQSPRCMDCPFAERCFARRHDNTQAFPVKSKKTEVGNRYFVYLYIEDGEHVLLHRRGASDIWQGLYEPYLLEFPASPTDAEVAERIMRLTDGKGRCRQVMKHRKQLLTHRCLWIDGYRLEVENLPEIEGYFAVAKNQRDDYATPKTVTTLFQLIDRLG